jgi:hypothetical protein
MLERKAKTADEFLLHRTGMSSDRGGSQTRFCRSATWYAAVPVLVHRRLPD